MAGIVAFYIVTKGEHPFGQPPDRERNLIDGKPVNLSNVKDHAARDLISWMLSHDPSDRPSADQALNHPYLQSKEEQFELLCKLGNRLEVKTGDNMSNVVQKLNADKTNWRTRLRPDVLRYLFTDPFTGKTSNYSSSWTECLRLIRNVRQHWYDRPRPLPQPEAFYLLGDLKEYFLNAFPNLPVEMHRAVRSSSWMEQWQRQMNLNAFDDRDEYFGKS